VILDATTPAGAVNQPPAVSLTSPANASTYTAPATITLNASASDPENRLSRVEFFTGETLLNADSISPYSFAWSSVAAGSYTLTAVAHDADGGRTTSTPVGITVNGPNQPPTVSLTSPASGATFSAPASITLAASASDPENRMARVDFFAGSTLLNSDASAPYSFIWSSAAAGSYALTAVARDADGGSTTSAVRTITVNATTSTQTMVVFTASSDHDANVTSYMLKVFTSGANPDTAIPVASSDLGKPVPNAVREISIDRTSFFGALSPGSYVVTVTAIGPGGQTRSAPASFTR
jgi:hypothetical protein